MRREVDAYAPSTARGVDVGTETYALPSSAAAPTMFATGVSGAGISGAATAAGRVPAQPDAGPVSWLSAPSGEYRSADPATRRPEPRLRQLIGVCGWAAVLGGVGLVLGIRALFGEIYDTPPGWYEPAMVITGLTGIGLTVAAFLTVQHVRRPWVLLGCASGALLVGMVLTALAF
jgi:hypothetical protein